MIQPQEARDGDNGDEEGSSSAVGRERAEINKAYHQLLDRPTTRGYVRVGWPNLTRRGLECRHLRRALRHLRRNACVGDDSVRRE